MMNRKLAWISFWAAGLVVLVAGCARQPAQPDIVLLTTEGVLEAEPADPGADVRVLEQAVTASPLTAPAAASVLTGRLPPEHGLRINGVGALDPATPTLATELADRGYVCAAFLSSPALDGRHGLTNGFKTYAVRASASEGVVDAVAAHLKKTRGKKPVFIWVHVAPFSGVGLTNTAAVSAAREAAIRERDRLFDLFPGRAIRAEVPLFALDPEAPFHGLSVAPPVTDVRVTVSGSVEPGVVNEPISIAAVKALLLTGGIDRLVPVYTESVLPWYAFGLPPLQGVRGGAEVPPLGLETVEPDVLATQAQMRALRRDGHLGEGLIPAYTNVNGVAVLDAAGEALVARAAAAHALSGREGVSAVEALIHDHPNVALFHEWLGGLHMRLQDQTAACNAFARASDLGVNRVWAYRQQSVCHMLIGNIPQAIDKAETAFLLNPDDPMLRRGLSRLLLNAGSALLAGGQVDAAAECLNRVHWLEPNHPDGLVQLARLQLAVGQTNSATGFLREALRVKPGHPAATQLLDAIR